MMAPIGKRLHIEAFNSMEEAEARDKELEFGENKMKMIEDRRIQPVTFKSRAQFSLWRKIQLKSAKKSDKRTKKELEGASRRQKYDTPITHDHDTGDGSL